MKPRLRHAWPRSPRAAIALQRRLAARVKRIAPNRPIRLVAGGDCAFTRAGDRIIAAWVVWDVEVRRVVARAHAIRRVSFPYVPGLLSFREAPALIAAAAKLPCEPDALILDGHGLAHPRRFGLACHVGVLLDRPTIGCAKSVLCGSSALPADEVGASSPLLHAGETIGAALRTRLGVKPVFVSVGHECTLESAVRLVLSCGEGFRLPEPTRRADQYVALLKRDAAAKAALRRASAGARRR